METFCGCADTYIRIGTEVKDGALTNFHIVTGSTNEKCDQYIIGRAKFLTYTRHPNGSKFTAVVGYTLTGKPMSYEQCLEAEEVESYLYFGELIIDTENCRRCAPGEP